MRNPEAAILLCGAGANPPGDLTVDTLRALAACEAVFAENLDAATLELVRDFCPRVEALGATSAEDAGARALEVLREAAAGRAIGVLSRGHPLTHGRVGRALVAACLSARRTWRTLPSVSAFSAALVPMRLSFGMDFTGMQCCSAQEILRADWTPHPGLPVLLDFQEPLESDAVLSALQRHFGGEHSAFHGPAGAERFPCEHSLRELAAHHACLGPGALLLLPPAAASETAQSRKMRLYK